MEDHFRAACVGTQILVRSGGESMTAAGHGAAQPAAAGLLAECCSLFVPPLTIGDYPPAYQKDHSCANWCASLLEVIFNLVRVEICVRSRLTGE